MALVPLVWDATCSDAFAMPYWSQTTTAADCVAVHAEERKYGKYSHLAPNYLFQPMVIESSGVLTLALCRLRALGSQLAQESG